MVIQIHQQLAVRKQFQIRDVGDEARMIDAKEGTTEEMTKECEDTYIRCCSEYCLYRELNPKMDGFICKVCMHIVYSTWKGLK